MKASLIRHIKGVDEPGNIIEVKMWEMVAPTADKPYGYKYSLVYIVNGVRVIGYDMRREGEITGTIARPSVRTALRA